MVLHSDFIESHIPHYDRTKEAIMQAWTTAYQPLKADLMVCGALYFQ